MKYLLATALALMCMFLTSLADAADDAQYVSRTGATTVNAGTDFWVQSVMLNRGTTAWTSSAGYSMMTIGPSGNKTFTINRLYMPANSSISPAAQATFTGLCTAPVSPGAYTMQWQCDKNGTAFGDPTPLLNITVTQGPDDAQFVSQTAVPTSIGPSKTFGVTFTLKNLGTATWGTNYSLFTMGSYNFSVPQMVSGTVAPLANGTFTATFACPSTPGTYTFQWRMSHSGVKFGQPTPSVTIVVSENAAAYVSRTGALNVEAGADFWVQNTMRNTGTITWAPGGGYSMMAVTPLNNTVWTKNRLYMPSGISIAPNAQATFTTLCTSPVLPGTYPMQWQCDALGTPFGDKSPLLSITVGQGPDNARFENLDGIPSIIRLPSFTATITMTNMGTATWGPGYALVPIGSYNFGVTSIPAPTTAPGMTTNFVATFTSPSGQGTFTFQMRMAHNGKLFGQATTKATIVVVSVTGSGG